MDQVDNNKWYHEDNLTTDFNQRSHHKSDFKIKIN